MTVPPRLSLGFSPCPNDTFIFYALVSGKVQVEGVNLSSEIHADVETLNLWALQAKLDITKLSFHTLGHVLEDYVLLRSGAALGRGCGPILVTKDTGKSVVGMKVACPGMYTTAAMLFKMRYPECDNLVEMRFDQIMPAIVDGTVDAGVIIHESRFTHTQYGLQLICDLGSWWEETTGCPIPLGGIVARRALGVQLIKRIEQAVEASVLWARENNRQCRSYIRAHAQELDDHIIDEHIGLYVNDYSIALGEEGLAAVREFLKRGEATGVFKCSLKSLVV